MGRYIWCQEEIEILETIIGYYHPEQLVKLYQILAKKRKLPERTSLAIKHKARLLFGTIKALDDNYTAALVANILGINRMRVLSWISRGYLQSDRVGINVVVKKKYLKEFAEKYPRLLKHSSHDGLVCIFGKIRTKEIESKFKDMQLPTGKAQKVYCFKTGKIYNSLTQASKDTFIDRRTIANLVKKKEGWGAL